MGTRRAWATGLAATALAVVAPLGGSASAGWSVTAGGSGAAASTTLPPPSGFTAVRTPVMRLSWSGPSWVSEYRVLRSLSPTGPWSQLATVPGGSTGYDDTTTGAGTWSYTVQAVRGSWTSSSSVTAADLTYVLRNGTAFTGTNCPSGGTRADALQGHTPTGTGTAVALDGSATFCTDTFTSGQSVAAGTTTVVLHVVNALATKVCTFTLTLSHNEKTTLGSAAVSVPAGQAVDLPQTIALPTSAAAFSSGDRLALTLSNSENCGSSAVHFDGTGVPSRMTLPG